MPSHCVLARAPRSHHSLREAVRLRQQTQLAQFHRTISAVLPNSRRSFTKQSAVFHTARGVSESAAGLQPRHLLELNQVPYTHVACSTSIELLTSQALYLLSFNRALRSHSTRSVSIEFLPGTSPDQFQSSAHVHQHTNSLVNFRILGKSCGRTPGICLIC